jgi:hypothetical protein
LNDTQIFLILVGLLAISASSLVHDSFAQSSESSSEAELDSKFLLQPTQSAQIKSEELKVTFVTVLADSRCPADVVCVWQGRADIELFVQKGDDEGITVYLSVGGDSSPEKLVFDMYLIQFLELAPYPYSTQTIKPEEYTATIKISKQEEMQEENILPPLKQVKRGQEPSCKENLVLIKKYNGAPACVKPETREKLIERGWALE